MRSLADANVPSERPGLASSRRLGDLAVLSSGKTRIDLLDDTGKIFLQTKERLERDHWDN